MRLPNRNYLLYTGPVADALALVEAEQQTPNLWWPDDRAWCVASGIDLPWTYLGGSAALVDAVLAAPGIEAMPAQPQDTHHLRVAGWQAEAVDASVAELLATGQTRLRTFAYA